jgi:hypothetical protein
MNLATVLQQRDKPPELLSVGLGSVFFAFNGDAEAAEEVEIVLGERGAGAVCQCGAFGFI